VPQSSIIYARVSSKEQEREGYSIDAQLKFLRGFATDKGFAIVREFTEAVSAKGAGRKVFNEMLSFLKANPHVKYLLCEKTDRLSRNFRDIATLDQLMNEQGLTILLVKENTELSKNSKSHEKLMFDIRTAIAKNYSDNLSEEVIKGMTEKASQGEYPGGTVPYGYVRDIDSGKIVPDRLRAHHVRELFELYAANKYSLRGLAAWARELGLTTPRTGKPMTLCQVERILKNPFYYGEFRWAERTYQGTHEPLVSRDLFLQVQRSLKRPNKPQLGRTKFAFGNLMVCSKCGCKITAEIKKGKYVYYHCTGMRGGCDLVYVREVDIIDQFTDLVDPLHLTESQAQEIMRHLEKRYRSSSANIESERARLEIRIKQLNAWLEKAYVDKLEGKISEDLWLTRSRDWETQKVQLSATLDNLQSGSGNFLPTAGRILELAQELPAIWVERNPFEKRQIVDLLYSNCTLDGATLSATYRKPFNYIAEGSQSKIKRPQYHPPQTPIEFMFRVRFSYSTMSGTRWKTIC